MSRPRTLKELGRSTGGTPGQGSDHRGVPVLSPAIQLSERGMSEFMSAKVVGGRAFLSLGLLEPKWPGGVLFKQSVYVMIMR